MRARSLAALLVACATAACGGDDEEAKKANNPDQPFGETAIIVIANPVVNTGHTTPVPSNLGTEREGIVVDAEPGGAGTTDATGLTVIDDGLAKGALSLAFSKGPSLPFTIVEDGDVYDLAVAYDGSTVSAFDNFPIRYAVGGQILEFDSSSDPALVTDALATDGNIVFFKQGSFESDLLIQGSNVVFFGEGFTKGQVEIRGSVEVKGTNVKIRGFDIAGNITVAGNGFGMSFTLVRGTTAITGNAAAFLRNAFCGAVTVPSSNASLLDNDGLDPLPKPDAPCAGSP
jgi:hypothetical protein